MSCSGFDEHMDWDKEESDSSGAGKEESAGKKSEGEVSQSGSGEKDWKRILAEAQTLAQQRGTMPMGMEREINQIHKSKINWKHFLQKAIRNSVPMDYTWSKPNKKYIGEGVYLPSTYGETVKVLFGIDTSGSQSQDDLTDSVSEMHSISKMYSGIEFRAMTFDTKVHEDIHIYNGNVKKLKELKMKGGGGSDSADLYDIIKKKGYNRNTKLLIFFTDGYMGFPKVLTIPTIIVLTKNHCPKNQLPTKNVVAVVEMN